MRRDPQRLNDILEALDWIAKTVAAQTEADFLADETLCYAVAQKLTIIGEAVARLSPELTARHNSVPWPDIVGLRNILVHEYFGIYWVAVAHRGDGAAERRLRRDMGNHEAVRRP